MAKTLNPRFQRLKLLALIAIFAAPMMLAWGMVEWRIGIPDERTAHGELEPDVPAFDDWPLASMPESPEAGDWVMAFDCTDDCAALADRWWRVHRALGREAPRVSRLRIGGEAEPLPGEVVAQWEPPPGWRSAGRLWVLDPLGNAVLAYDQAVATRDVLDDINQLLRMNPAL